MLTHHKKVPKRCQVPECDLPAKAQGLCNGHYGRLRCCVNACDRHQWLYGRCKSCFRGFDPVLYEQLKNVASADDRLEKFNRLIQPQLPPPPTKWEWQGNEDALAEQYGRNDEMEATKTE